MTSQPEVVLGSAPWLLGNVAESALLLGNQAESAALLGNQAESAERLLLGNKRNPLSGIR